ncbi:MAG: DUF882 domain-containing protein [Alphaproteobacteria bacterium]
MGGALDRTRRRFLQAGFGACITLAASPVRAAYAPRSLGFLNLHTDERATITYWANGEYVADALREIDWLLRDHRTGEILPIDPNLLDLLHRLKQRLETEAPFHVISGYRSPATNAKLIEAGHGVAATSLHMQGQAIDIRIPERSLMSVRAAALSLESGGVGYYPKSDFVHVDVGRVRMW